MFKQLLITSALLCAGTLAAQTPVTVTLNDAVVNNSSVKPQGAAIDCINNYQSCQVMKNAIQADNPGAEGLHIQNDWLVASPTGTTHGSPVSFTTNQFYIPSGGNAILASRWVGAHLYMAEYANGASGCTDTSTGVTVNGADGTEGTMTLTFAAGNCPNLSANDLAIMSKDEVPANGASAGGFTSSGGTLTYNTAVPIDGAVSFEMKTLASGAYALLSFPFDTDASNIGFLLDGTFQLSMRVKLISGPGTFNISVARAGGSSVCSFANGTLTATSTAQTLTATCTDNEATSKPPGGVVSVGISSASQSDILIDDVSFVQTSSQDPSNTTPFRDKFVNGIKSQFYGGGSGGPLRLGPMFQNGQTYANWTSPFFQSMGVTAEPAGTQSKDRVQLQDYLALANLLGADAYWHLPCPATTADAIAEFNFSATYGSIPEQDISECNEAWNTGTGGQNLPNYSTYLSHAARIFSGIRASSSYVSSKTRLIANMQYGNTYGFMSALAAVASSGGSPDGPEFAPYFGFPFTSNATPESMFRVGLGQIYSSIRNSSAVLAQAVATAKSANNWGASGASAPQLFIYEQADGDTQACGTNYPACQPSGTASVDAQNLQILNVSAINATTAAYEAAEMQYAGFRAINYFGFNLYAQSGTQQLPSGLSGPAFQQYLWGNIVDCGGALAAMDGANCRWEPEGLGAQIANYAVVGGIMAGATSNSPTYTTTASPGGYGPATGGVPYLASYYYSDGANTRGVLLVNTSTTVTYAVSLAAASGTHAPVSTATGLQLSTSSLFNLNVAQATVPNYTTAIAPTSTTPATVTAIPLTYTAGSPISVPPGGVASVVYSTAVSVPPVTKQSTGAVINSGAVSQLLRDQGVFGR